MDIEAIRKEFPIVRNWAFFNHAGVAPISNRAKNSMVAMLEDLTQHGTAHARDWDSTYQRARVRAAELIHADPTEIAFIKNTTEGISFVANGLDWQAGDNLITSDKEFPANTYPWLNLETRGVEVRMVKERDGRIALDDIHRAIDDRTRVIALSYVAFSSGFRNDLESIGKLCEERGILFVVDAIQGLGALQLDVQVSKIDVLSADGHKWLLGPEGCGIFYCARSAMERIRVTEVGWSSVIHADDYLSYDLSLRPDATRFECGTLNTVGICGLDAALALLLEVGIKAIEAHVLSLTDLLCEGLEEKRYTVFSSRRPGEKSGIVSFYSSRHNSPSLSDLLRNHRIVIALRDGRIRVSPHFYNTEWEIEQLVDVLP